MALLSPKGNSCLYVLFALLFRILPAGSASASVSPSAEHLAVRTPTTRHMYAFGILIILGCRFGSVQAKERTVSIECRKEKEEKKKKKRSQHPSTILLMILLLLSFDHIYRKGLKSLAMDYNHQLGFFSVEERDPVHSYGRKYNNLTVSRLKTFTFTFFIFFLASVSKTL